MKYSKGLGQGIEYQNACCSRDPNFPCRASNLFANSFEGHLPKLGPELRRYVQQYNGESCPRGAQPFLAREEMNYAVV